MEYHCSIKHGDGKYQYLWNGSLNWFKKNLLIPLFNGQVVVFEFNGKEKVLNMRSVLEVQLYKTSEKLKGSESDIIPIMNDESFNKYNCTKEILNEIKSDLATSDSKSLIEKSFMAIENQVFVIMKFGDDELDSAYDGVMVPLIEEMGLVPIRVDRIQDSGKISEQILENIAKSKFILADLSGEKPNCYYETGFAHAIGKKMVLTIKKDEKLHFDLAGHRFIIWKTEADLRKQLRNRFKTILEEI